MEMLPDKPNSDWNVWRRYSESPKPPTKMILWRSQSQKGDSMMFETYIYGFMASLFLRIRNLLTNQVDNLSNNRVKKRAQVVPETPSV